MTSPFFADATLDLAEAHDIADTPEATRPNFNAQSIQSNQSRLQIPSLFPDQQQQFLGGIAEEPTLQLTRASSPVPYHQQQQQQQQLHHPHHHSMVQRSLSSPPELASSPPRSTPLHADPSCTSDAASVKHQTTPGHQFDDNNNHPSGDGPDRTSSTFARITGGVMEIMDHPHHHHHHHRAAAVSMSTLTSTPSRKPRWPRDMAWTAAFWFTVPIALLYPIWHWHWYSTAAAAASSSATVPPLLPAAASPLAKHPLSFATLHAITWSIAVVVVLTRYLYRSVAGGDGDAARILAAQLIATAAPMSVLVYAFLTVTVWSACPTAALAAVVPAAYGMRDVCAFRQWRQRTDFAGAGYASRIAFFQAMVGMALDILSRSLRRASLVRGLTTVLLCQLAILLLWRASLLAALSLLFAKRSEAGIWNWMLVFLSWGAGRWATATAMRVLTLLASAGVMNWCNEQGMLLSEVTANGGGGGANLRENGNTSSHNHTEDDNEFAHTNSNNGTSRIPEAYRTVDASVYQSVLSLEDVLDDDDEDDDVVDGNAGLEMNHNDDRRWQHSRQSPHQLQSNNRNASTAQQHHQQHPRQTVKSILWTGVTINFGAIAHCGMLGGLAQLIWSQIRRVEAASATSRNNGPLGVRSGDGGEQFQGMAIGTSSGSNDSMVNQLWTRAIILARSFVRLHSDLAMTHVAAYYKGYARAARDVAMIIDETGLEPILHEDISTHICTCIGGSIAGFIVLLTTYLLLHQRSSRDEVTDVLVVTNMLIAFVLSYTLIFTVIEPLRAAIKASYIAFAQNPRCLSQAYPLIYHRLCRLSESSLS